MKTCTRCKTVYNIETWNALPFIGVQHLNDGFPDLEMRNCTFQGCDSPLGREIKVISLVKVTDNSPCKVCGSSTFDRKRTLLYDTVLCTNPSECVERSLVRKVEIEAASLVQKEVPYPTYGGLPS